MRKNQTLFSRGCISRTNTLLRRGIFTLGLTMATAGAAWAVPISVTGTVYDDGNGGTINGVPISSIPGNQLYVYLIDNSNVIIDKAAVSAFTFTYSLTAQSNANYSVALSTANYAISATNPVLGLPVSWAPTAEGTTSSGDGTPDFMVAINSSNNLVINFAIDARPTGYGYVISNMTYDANGRVVIPAGAFTGSDLEDGVYSPGFGGRMIDLYQAAGGQLYYNNSLISFSSAATATRISNFNVSLLRFQPISTGPRQFAFSTVDNAGVPESVPNSVVLGGAALPVSTLSASGHAEGKHNRIMWQASSGKTIKGYVVERSDDGIRFLSLATVPAKASSETSTQMQRYDYTDFEANATPHSPYLYRIRMMEANGAFAYSSIIRLSNAYTQEPQLSLAPNPSNGTLNIDMATGLKSEEPVTVSVYNAMGTQVLTRVFTLTEGRLSTSIDMSALAAGNYYVQMQNAGMQPLVKPIVLLPH